MARNKIMQILDSARKKAREDYLAALKDGRTERSNTFKAKKGKGSYSRKNKHKEW